MNKKLVFQDIPNYEKHEGYVIIKDPVTKDVLFEGHNKVIIPGSFLTLQKHFPNVQLPSKTSNI